MRGCLRAIVWRTGASPIVLIFTTAVFMPRFSRSLITPSMTVVFPHPERPSKAIIFATAHGVKIFAERSEIILKSQLKNFSCLDLSQKIGSGRIRTPDTLPGIPHFKCGVCFCRYLAKTPNVFIDSKRRRKDSNLRGDFSPTSFQD